MKPFESSHNLDFMCCSWPRDPSWIAWKIGTCNGLYQARKEIYSILAIVNDEPGNGHFQDVLDWFENSCRRDGKALQFSEIMNDRLKKHLVEKRGFEEMASGDCVKHFKNQ